MNLTEAVFRDLSNIVQSTEQVALFENGQEVSYEGYTRIPTKLNLIKNEEGIAIVNEEEIFFEKIGNSSKNFRVVFLDKDEKDIFDFQIMGQVNKGDGILFRKNEFMFTLE